MADIDAQIVTAKQQKADARKANNQKAYDAADKNRTKAVKNYKTKNKALTTLLNSLEEPAPEKDEFALVDDETVKDELAAIQQDKQWLKDNGGTQEEFADLITRRNKIRKDAIAIAKKQQEARDLESQLAAEINPKKREELDDQLALKNAEITKATQKLHNYINPPQKPTKQDEFDPNYATAETLNELSTLQQQQDDLRNARATATEINNVGKRIDKIKRDSTTIAKDKKEAEALEAQMQTTTDAREREKIQRRLDGLNAKIETNSQKLSDYINPPQKPAPKTYAPVNDDVKEEISRLNRQILDTPDDGKSEVSVKDLNARLQKLLKLNTEVGQRQDEVQKAQDALQDARDQGDDQARLAAKSAFEIAKENLADKQKELDEFIHPPIKEKEKPAPFEPYNDEVGNRIADLNNRIDMEQDAATVNNLRKERDAIQKQSDVVRNLQKQINEQKAIMNDAKKTPDEKRRAKEKSASMQINFDTAKGNLDELLHPQPKQEKKKEPEHYEPTGEAKAEIDKLNAEIKALVDDDEQGNSAEIAKKTKRRDDIQNQFDKVERLKGQRDKKIQERTQAHAAGNYQTEGKLTGEIAQKVEDIKKEQKNLDELLHPRNEDEEPVETYSPVNDKVKAAFDELNRKIAQAEDGSTEKAKIEQDRRALENANDNVAKLRNEINRLGKDLSRKVKGSKGYKKVQNSLDNKRNALTNAEKRLNKLVEPPKPKVKQEQPKPKKYAPATEAAGKAISQLKGEIKKLETQISNAETDFLAGRANGDKVRELTTERTNKKALLKAIQEQSDKCSELKDKAATALRIMNDSSKPQTERDKASDALSEYGAQLRDELQQLQDLIPAEPSKTKPTKTAKDKEQKQTSAKPAKDKKQKQPSAKPAKDKEQKQSPVKADEPQPAAPEPVTEKPAADVQAEPQEKPEPVKDEDDSDEALNREIEELKKELETEDEEYTTDDGSTFGSIESARRDMLESLKGLGIEPIKKERTQQPQTDTRRPKLVNFVEDDSDEALNREIEELKKELDKISSMPMFNPKIWKSALKIGAIYVQRGINNFADWAARMTETIGEKSKPWQNAIWETINDLPEGAKFDENQIMNVSKYIGALQEKGAIETLDDVREQFEQDLGKEVVKQILPMIQASYKGIQKYFDDKARREAQKGQAVKKEPKNPLEKAVQKISDLIEKWNKTSLDAWKEKNPHRVAPPTREVRELSDMVLAGAVEPDKAVDAANKLLNGTDGKEQNAAREILYGAREKMKELTDPKTVKDKDKDNKPVKADEPQPIPPQPELQDTKVEAEPKETVQPQLDTAPKEDITPPEPQEPQELQPVKVDEPQISTPEPEPVKDEGEVKPTELLKDENPEQPESELVYPDGALTYGDKTAAEAFKRGYSDKKFDKNMSRKVEINGKEMTRLEVVEAMAKRKLPEDAMKLNKKEREYLKWLDENLIEPLQAIRLAGIQNEQASKVYNATVDMVTVYFEDSKGDAATLANLEKLAKVLDGDVKKNSSGNTLFDFFRGSDSWAFEKTAEFFMNNRHLPYFKNTVAQNSESISKKNDTTDKKKSLEVKKAEEVALEDENTKNACSQTFE